MDVKEAWSRIAPWPNAGAPRQRLRLEADGATRARVAKLLEVEAVKALSADLAIAPWLDGLEITGRVDAVVERICGVSLDPFDETITESVEARRAPPGSPNLPLEAPADHESELPEHDPAEAGETTGVDVAALCIETLALALDPYPRKPGVEFEAAAPDPADSPFAALARLKRGGEGG